MLVSEDSANNSSEDAGQTLVHTLLCSPQKEVPEQTVVVHITHSCAISVLQKNLDLEEENCLEYLSGYFYKRLLGFHSDKDCIQCSKYAQKYSKDSLTDSVSHIFLYFKRFNTEKATLYDCKMEFVSYVRYILQICSFVFEKLPDAENIIEIVIQSCLKFSPSSLHLCSNQMIYRFTHVVARTILFYKVKWNNDKLRKKEPKSKKSHAKKKVEKLSHK